MTKGCRGLDVLAEWLRRPQREPSRVSRCWQAVDRYAVFGLNDNPFRRQRFEPSRFPYLAPRGPGLEEIAREVASSDAVEIVGSHGHGKSFLLEHLYRRFAESTPSALVSADRPLGVTARIMRRGDIRWFVDRAERLPKAELAALGILLRSGRRRAVLAVHRSLGLRRLPAEPVDGLLFAAVVREALRLDGIPQQAVTDATIADAWDRAGGNVRIGLERLYRLFEDAVCEAAAEIRDTLPPSRQAIPWRARARKPRCSG